MALLEIKDLSVSIDQTSILNSLSLQLNAGEILAVAGESGSGKTMTALAVAGLLPLRAKQTGEILFDGQKLNDLNDQQMCRLRGRDIGMVFQEPMTALNPAMTIGKQVAETVRIHRKVSRSDAMKLARETLDRVGLPAEKFSLDRYPHNLSGGQRQRVAIAIAVAMKPKLLIADEPTTALDVTTQAEILDLFKQLVCEDNVGLILVTHDLAVVAETADRVVVMKDGDIVDQGDILSVFRNSGHAYTKNLLKNSVHVPQRSNPLNTGANNTSAQNTSAPNTDGQNSGSENTGKQLSGDPPVLEVSNVVRDYFGARRLFGERQFTRAVNDVSLQIAANENVGLVGESGCGKSTLLRTILGLDQPQAGQVRVFGQPFPTSNKAEMRKLRGKLQVVFQDPYGTFDPRWRVRDLICENFHLYDSQPTGAEGRRKIDEMLEQVGMKPSHGDQYPHEFSGGQRQRIAIARALITGPSIIALDEAVSALDVCIRAQILDLLADLSDRLGVSYLFVTHDLSVVRSITDRVLVMQNGRIVEQGVTSEVFANPQHAYTAELLAAVPDMGRALSRHEKALD